MYPFSIDESLLGMPIGQFAETLLVEGVKVQRQYLLEPIFEYDMLKYQRTYGDSRYPFSAFAYQPPHVDDFPGFHDFRQRLLLMFWSHNVQPRHVDAIAAAVRKVASLVSPPSDLYRRSIQKPEVSAV
jgi:hypothetical protein